MGLTIGKIGSNNRKEWDYQKHKVGLTSAKSGTNSGKLWD